MNKNNYESDILIIEDLANNFFVHIFVNCIALSNTNIIINDYFHNKIHAKYGNLITNPNSGKRNILTFQ